MNGTKRIDPAVSGSLLIALLPVLSHVPVGSRPAHFQTQIRRRKSCASCLQMLSVVVARQSAIIDVGPLNLAKRFERDWTKGRAGNQESCRRLAHDDRVTTLTAI